MGKDGGSVSRATFQVPCEHCGTSFYPHWKKGRLTRFCSGECYSQSRSIPVGEKHGRLTSLGLTNQTVDGSRRYTRFRCDCGNEHFAQAKHVRSGLIVSCGCHHNEQVANRNRAGRTHGASNTREYKSYNNARYRCTDPKNVAYANYGGRGIEFRFNSFEEWLDELGPVPSVEHTVDRIDNDGHYERGNVRWATPKEQAGNKRPRRWKRKPP